ncbi:hypothetical protein [Pelistega suis]|nr:hypothetical protein [Pelistega suis]MCQ9328026.1 hypothetical protein [Pelistega suis]
MAMNNSDSGFGLSNQQYSGAHWVHISENGAAETAPVHTYFALRLTLV